MYNLPTTDTKTAIRTRRTSKKAQSEEYYEVDGGFFVYQGRIAYSTAQVEQMAREVYRLATATSDNAILSIWYVRRVMLELAFRSAQQAANIARERRLSHYCSFSRVVKRFESIMNEDISELEAFEDMHPDTWSNALALVDEYSAAHAMQLYWQANQWAKDAGYTDDATDFDVVVEILTSLFFCYVHVRFTERIKADLEAKDERFRSYNICPMKFALLLAVRLNEVLPMRIDINDVKNRTIRRNIDCMADAYINDLINIFIAD